MKHPPEEPALFESHSGGRYGPRGGRHVSHERTLERLGRDGEDEESPWRENAVRDLEETRSTLD